MLPFATYYIEILFKENNVSNNVCFNLLAFAMEASGLVMIGSALGSVPSREVLTLTHLMKAITHSMESATMFLRR